MGLQADAEGNFYYTKAARHGLPAVVPQHGTLLRVGRDGRSTEILATGFRAPNGVCLNPDGTYFLSDQEGFWTPKNRINWVKRGGFYGNMWGYHEVTDTSDSAMEPPICWITNAFDRSPAELVRVKSTHPAWAPCTGGAAQPLLRQRQGSWCRTRSLAAGCRRDVRLPLPAFPDRRMRGQFHPLSGQFYACGLLPGRGPDPARRLLPAPHRQTDRGTDRLGARRHGLAITFTGRLDRKTAGDPSRYGRTWSLK
jgi:hypothetical protein